MRSIFRVVLRLVFRPGEQSIMRRTIHVPRIYREVD